jgi:hypothetical protein
MILRLALLVLWLCGCRTAPPPRPDATLVLEITGDGPAPAPQVYIDGRAVRPGATRVAAHSGRRLVEVRAPGHFPAYREVTLSPHATHTLRVRLRPDPDAPSAPEAVP